MMFNFSVHLSAFLQTEGGFFYSFRSKKQLFLPDFSIGGLPPPHFWRVGGFPLYILELLLSIIYKRVKGKAG